MPSIPLFLTPSTSAGIFERRGNLSRSAAVVNKWDFFPSGAKQGERHSNVEATDLGANLDEYWETVARNADRARSCFPRSEWFRTHLPDEPCVVERDVTAGERSEDEDPSALPFGRRPSNAAELEDPAPSSAELEDPNAAVSGDASSSADLEDLRPKLPRSGGHATSRKTAAAP